MAQIGVQTRQGIMITWYLILLLVVSPVSFVVYGWDKRLAKTSGASGGHGRSRKVNRVPEKTLHSIDALGGWPGGFLAQRFFRHKTRKAAFQIRFWLTVVLHVGTVAFLLTV